MSNTMNVSQSRKRSSGTKDTEVLKKRVKKEEQPQTPAKDSLVWNNNWLAFKETTALESIQLDPQSSLKWCRKFTSTEEGDALFKHVLQVSKFEHTEKIIRGRLVNLPRLQSWFADEGLVVKELFQKQKQHPWTPPMMKLRLQLEKELGVKFDFCLVNFYRDGNDYVSFHADNETRDTIASISLGATRRFLLRHISSFKRKLTRTKKPLTTPDRKDYEYSLSNGSLIVMLGDTQLHWKHSVPKEKRVKQPRINLTFRIKRDKD